MTQPPGDQQNPDPSAPPGPPDHGGLPPYGHGSPPPSGQDSPPPYGQGYPPQAYGQPWYPPAPYAPPYPVGAPTNTMAVLALVFAFVFPPLGIVFGVIGKNQIKQTGEQGDGLAVAGIVIGSVFTALAVIAIIFAIIAFAAVVSTVPHLPDFPTPSPSPR